MSAEARTVSCDLFCDFLRFFKNKHFEMWLCAVKCKLGKNSEILTKWDEKWKIYENVHLQWKTLKFSSEFLCDSNSEWKPNLTKWNKLIWDK